MWPPGYSSRQGYEGCGPLATTAHARGTRDVAPWPPLKTATGSTYPQLKKMHKDRHETGKAREDWYSELSTGRSNLQETDLIVV